MILVVRNNGKHTVLNSSSDPVLSAIVESSESEFEESKEVIMATLIAKMATNYLESDQATETEKEFITMCMKIWEEKGSDIKIEMNDIEYKIKDQYGYLLQKMTIPIVGMLCMACGIYAGGTIGGFVGKTTGTIFGILGGINGGLVGCTAAIPFVFYLRAKHFFGK